MTAGGPNHDGDDARSLSACLRKVEDLLTEEEVDAPLNFCSAQRNQCACPERLKRNRRY
jgi:hypothetical protein